MPVVGLILPPGFATLSFAPLTAFEVANMMLGRPFYEMRVVSAKGGTLPSSLGMTVETERADDIDFDTLLVGSAPDTNRPPDDLVEFLARAPSRIRRVASICVGAFILGEAGLLDGRRSTTHWMFGKELQARFPKTRVEIDRIFIADGPIWTSAGMTAGIDLALSLVERDLGSEVARQAALLEIDGKSDRVQQALDYASRHLDEELSIDQLARVACLSPRQFSRVFASETGQTPGRAIENLRLERAQFLLEQGRLPIETIAMTVGFGDRERMRRSFQRAFGRTPRSVRNGAALLAEL